MLTLPENIKQALIEEDSIIWIVKVTLDAETKYWSSAPIIFSDVGAVVGTYPMKDGIDSIEDSIDITMGGGMGAVGNTSITLNNLALEEGVHTEFLPYTYGTEWLRRQVKIGIVGVTSGIASTDILWLYAGIVDNVQFSRSEIIVDLIGEREKEQIVIPKTLINKVDYPYAPGDSIGQVLPILYGDYYTDWPNASLNWVYEKYELVPSICIDKTRNRFCMAGHKTKYAPPAGGVYFHDSGMKVPSWIYNIDGNGEPQEAITDEDDSGISTILISPGTIIGGMKPLFSRAGANNNITDFEKAIDGNSATYASVLNTTGILSMGIDGLPNGTIVDDAGGIDNNIALFIILDTGLVNAQSFILTFYDPAGSELDNVPVPATTTEHYLSLGTAFDSLNNISQLSEYSFNFREDPNNAPATETAKIKAFGIQIIFVIAVGLTERKPWKPPVGRTGTERRGPT